MSDMKQDGLSLGARLKHAWNAFSGKETKIVNISNVGAVSYDRPDRVRFHLGNERTILASIFTRIAIDVSEIKIQHVKLDEDERFIEPIKSGLNYCLNTEANIDQTSRAFIQDIVESMLDEGAVAVVPVDTTYSPFETGSYDIQTMRAAKIVQWFPRHVTVLVYNDRIGEKKELTLPKDQIAIIENPLYSVMNEPISTLKRLIHKLNLLDAVDEQTSSGKLDLIVQLPFQIKTELRRQEAEKRRKDIETQLIGNKYGIAYTDSTEKVTQLSRPVENKLMEQIEYLTSMLYSQLGMTKEVFDGTADERVMINYMSRTIEPIVSSITNEFNRKFLTKTARSQHQRIMYFNDAFRLATIDSMTANGIQLVTGEVITKNEFRQRLGYKPIEDQGADNLMNPNINPGGGMMPEMSEEPMDGQYQESPEESGMTLADMKVSELP